MNLITPHGPDCSRSTMYPLTQYIQPLKEKEDPVVHSINRREKDHLNKKLYPQHQDKYLIHKFCYIVGMPFTTITFVCGFVYFLGNILLAWAVLQCPYISKSLSSPPPQNKNDWVHSVIFEPQLKMQLMRSSYKITSFLDFQPFLQGFQSVDNYIKNLITDINNPAYFQRLIAPFHDNQVTPLSTHDTIRTFLSSPACRSHPHACQAKMKFE